MDIEVLKQTTPIARKEYYCGLGELAGDNGFPKGMTFSELRSVTNYQNKHRKILKGERYIKQVNKYDGRIYTWRACKDIYDIFCKYDLFPDL